VDAHATEFSVAVPGAVPAGKTTSDPVHDEPDHVSITARCAPDDVV
jgi:hypothetical protein